jgi:hypothetical protein
MTITRWPKMMFPLAEKAVALKDYKDVALL